MALVRPRALVPALALCLLFVAASLTGCLQASQCSTEQSTVLTIHDERFEGISRFVSMEGIESNLRDDWAGSDGVAKYSLDPFHRPGVLAVRWAGLSGWTYVVSLFGLESKTVGVHELSAFGAVACACPGSEGSPGIIDLEEASKSWHCAFGNEWIEARCVPLTGKLTVNQYETICGDLGKGEVCAEQATLRIVGEGKSELDNGKRDTFEADFTLDRDEEIVGVPVSCD